jgi:hypothetical protein
MRAELKSNAPRYTVNTLGHTLCAALAAVGSREPCFNMGSRRIFMHNPAPSRRRPKAVIFLMTHSRAMRRTLPAAPLEKMAG